MVNLIFLGQKVYLDEIIIHLLDAMKEQKDMKWKIFLETCEPKKFAKIGWLRH